MGPRLEDLMRHKQVIVPGFGLATIRPSTAGDLLEAEKDSRDLSPPQAADRFARSILRRVLVSPTLSRSAARFGRNRRAFACGFLPMRRAFTCRYPVQNQLRTYLDTEDLAGLSTEILDVFVPFLAESLDIGSDYESTDDSTPATQRLYDAYGLFRARMLAPLREALAAHPALMLPPLALPTSLTNLGRGVLAGMERIREGFVAIAPVLMEALRVASEAGETWLTQSYADALHHYHWWYVPSMPRSLVMEVHRRYTVKRGQGVHALICKHYRADDHAPLKALVEDWYNLPYFRTRKHIFDAALRAHMRGEYELSIPALLPHIEGIGSDFLAELAAREDKVYWDLLLDLLKDGVSSRDLALVESLENARSNVFFAKFTASQEYKGRVVNRHAVLHGILVDYATEANSLRSFLMLESQHHFLRVLLSRHPIPTLRAMYQRSLAATPKKKRK